MWMFADLLAANALGSAALSSTIVLLAFIALFNSLAGLGAGVLNGLERFRENTVLSIVTSIVTAVCLIPLSGLFGIVGASQACS